MQSFASLPTTMLLLLAIAIIGFLPAVTSLRCESGSEVYYRSYDCPVGVTQCFKFVCNSTYGQQLWVNRGCSLMQACQANMDTCRQGGVIGQGVGQGAGPGLGPGIGQCFECSDRDDCNGASFTAASFAAVLLPTLLLSFFVRR